jgi:hypothetical protein
MAVIPFLLENKAKRSPMVSKKKEAMITLGNSGFHCNSHEMIKSTTIIPPAK